jgi:hypothetical protein
MFRRFSRVHSLRRRFIRIRRDRGSHLFWLRIGFLETWMKLFKEGCAGFYDTNSGFRCITRIKALRRSLLRRSLRRVTRRATYNIHRSFLLIILMCLDCLNCLISFSTVLFEFLNFYNITIWYWSSNFIDFIQVYLLKNTIKLFSLC